jgi:hypothetical protein
VLVEPARVPVLRVARSLLLQRSTLCIAELEEGAEGVSQQLPLVGRGRGGRVPLLARTSHKGIDASMWSKRGQHASMARTTSLMTTWRCSADSGTLAASGQLM